MNNYAVLALMNNEAFFLFLCYWLILWNAQLFDMAAHPFLCLIAGKMNNCQSMETPNQPEASC